MKYLDERIVISVNLGTPMPSAGVYKFYVYEYDEGSQSEDDEVIFVGNYYYARNGATQKFDITDIVRSRIYTHASYLPDTAVRYGFEGSLIKRFRVRAYADAGSVTSSWTDVAMIYRYPNVKKNVTDGNPVFNYSASITDMLRPAMQGYYPSRIDTHYNLNPMPHYPLKYTSQYKFAQTFIHSTNVQDFRIDYTNSEVDDSTTISVGQFDSRSTTCMIPLNSLMDWQYHDHEIYNGEDMNLFATIDGDQYIKVGVMDACYKRYYLQWRDRYGGWQSQAFNDTIQYSEDYDVSEVQDYTNDRKKSAIQVQPKWKLTSGWIDEKYFPIYESIFVSPIVLLYDTKEDAHYVVLVNGSFTEKTFKNEKKLLNLTLDLEQSTKQSILY